jgi:hypothetical protein
MEAEGQRAVVEFWMSAHNFQQSIARSNNFWQFIARSNNF